MYRNRLLQYGLAIIIGIIVLFPTSSTHALSLNPLDYEQTQSDLRDDLNRKPLLQIRIPGLTFSNIASSSDETGVYFYISWIPELIAAVYKFGIAIASIVAVVMIIIQGARLIISGGNSETVSEAYKKINHAVIGLLIAWGSFAILYNVNPKLTEFNPLKVKVVETQELDVSPSTEDSVDLSNEITPQITASTVPYFGQYDSRWGNAAPGSPEWPFDTSQCKTAATIKGRGCGSTSLAMILKYFNKNVTPLDTSKFALGCAGAMSANSLQANWPSSPWADLKLQRVKKDRAIELATNNAPLIVNCHPCTGYTGAGKLKTYSGHYMVITGSSDGGQTFNINDPGGNPVRNNAIIKMTRTQLLTPNKDEALEGCGSNNECLSKINTMNPPSFIYIHP